MVFVNTRGLSLK